MTTFERARADQANQHTVADEFLPAWPNQQNKHDMTMDVVCSYMKQVRATFSKAVCYSDKPTGVQDFTGFVWAENRKDVISVYKGPPKVGCAHHATSSCHLLGTW